MKSVLRALALSVIVAGSFALSVRSQEGELPLPLPPGGEKKAQEIRVGVYVLNIGKFDLSSGAYTVDFYLSLSSDEPFEPNTFEFMNGRATSMELLKNEPKAKDYRIQASLYQNVSLRAYPFDRHVLSIGIEEKTRSANEAIYVPDPSQSGVDDLVTFVGWEMAGTPKGRALEHDYAVFGEKYSRFVFEIPIRRTALAAILKAFLPISFILLVGLLSLIIAVDKIPLRFGLNTSTLLAAVMFHLNVTSTLPPVGYLTFADRFMIVSYIVLILCLISTLVLMNHTDKKEEVAARGIFRLSLTLVPLITVILFVALFLMSSLGS